MTIKKPLFNTSKALAIFMVQLNEAYQIAVLLPFVVFMVRDFEISAQNLGIYTSILNAAFCGCQFPVSYLWGYISDKIGRRKTLLVGLFFSTIALIAFGISQTYTQALIARCIQGLFFGNLGVLKAYLADITDSTNRARGFAMISIAFGFGTVLGAMLGGILIITHDPDAPDDEYIKTTSILKIEPFETKIPYFLPCIFGAMIAISGMIMTMLFIHDEKLEDEISNTNNEIDIKNDDKNTSHSLPLLDDKYFKNDTDYFSLLGAISQSGCGQSQAYTLAYPIDAITTKSKDKQPLINKLKQSNDELNYYEPEINNFCDLFNKTSFIHGLIQYGGVAIAYMMYKEMGPVYMAQALDFNSQWIGYAMAWSGINLLVFAYFMQPPILKKYKHKSILSINHFIFIIGTLMTPAIYYLKSDPINIQSNIILVFIFLCETITTCSVSIVFVIATVSINNLVPNKAVGKANGVGQTLASFVRGVGPTITGFIWSDLSYPYFIEYKFTVFFAFMPAVIICILCMIDNCLYIKPNFQYSWKDRAIKEIKENKKKEFQISMEKFDD